MLTWFLSMGIAFILVLVAIAVLQIIAVWKIFEKAGQPGWAVFIPIYNAYVFLQVAGKPAWWLILMLIPFVNFIVGIIALVALARNFGQGTGFVLGMIFLPFVFYPVLGFGSARYVPVA